MERTKEQVRRELQARREALSASEREERSAAIRDRLTGMDYLEEADTVFLYIAIDNEVDTRPLLDDLLESGRQVAVPVVKGEEMAASLLQDTAELEPGPFDVPQPAEQYRRALDPVDIDLSLVPGVAFDEHGNRIGRGEGYYDRFLADAGGVAVGLAYEFQVVDRIDPDPWDVAVDGVVTENQGIGYAP